jgi:hypothetical protein
MSQYSSGPFSKVGFFHTVHRGLRTFTYRKHREVPRGSLISTLYGSTYAGGPTFNEVYVDTACLPSSSQVVTTA